MDRKKGTHDGDPFYRKIKKIKNRIKNGSFYKSKTVFSSSVFLHFFALVCVVCTCMQVTLESRGAGFPGTGITGRCEPPDKGIGNQTWVH